MTLDNNRFHLLWFYKKTSKTMKINKLDINGTNKYVLSIRYKSGAWTYYKVSKHRNTNKLVSYFRNKEDFECGSLFATNSEGYRMYRIMYFNNNMIKF